MNFPSEEIMFEYENALACSPPIKKTPEKTPVKRTQAKIESFFGSKGRPAKKPRIEDKEKLKSIKGSCEVLPPINVKVPTKLTKLTTESSFTALADLLDLGTTDHINEAASRPLQLMCSQVRPMLKTFIEQDQQYDGRPNQRPRTQSDLHKERLQMRNSLQMLSEEVRNGEKDLKELKSHSLGPISFVSEAAKERLTARQIEYNQDLMRRLSEVSQKLPSVNAKLRKQILYVEREKNQAQGKGREAQKTCFKGNITQTWEEALEAVGGREDYSEGCKMDFFGYRDIKTFLDHKASAGVTYFTVDEVLLHLNKPEHEKRGLTKLMMKNLPIIQIEEGKQSLFMDARICLANPENIFYICQDAEDGNKSKGGRPSGTFKMKPEHIEALKTFIESSCTVSAHDRRQDDLFRVGSQSRSGLGTTWSAIHRNLAETFFTPSLKWDKKTTRRAGLAPNLKAKSRVYYRGAVKAKPQSLRNDRPLKLHSAARHCHVNVRYVLEWSAMHPDLVSMFSADNKV